MTAVGRATRIRPQQETELGVSAFFLGQAIVCSNLALQAESWNAQGSLPPSFQAR